MSVHRRQRANRQAAWQVSWRDNDGRQRAETYATKREAQRRDEEIRELKWRGKLEAADAGTEPLRAAADAWWTDHVEPTLAQTTALSYAHVLDRHLMPHLGDTPIRDIDSARVVRLQRELRAQQVGPAMSHRTLMVLSGILRHAVIRGRIERNPVQPVRVAQPRRKRAIRPLAPETIEAIRSSMLARDDMGGATFVSVLGYAGLRPGEATALSWEHVGRRTLLVEQTRSEGSSAKETKTGVIRTVRLLGPLADDLRAWRLRSGRPASDSPIFPRTDGMHWRADDYRNWRRRRFDPAAMVAGATGARPYDLRHSFASLMIQAGYSPVELATELGHSPTLTLNTYAHVFSEFARGERIEPAAVIREARAAEAAWRTRSARHPAAI